MNDPNFTYTLDFQDIWKADWDQARRAWRRWWEGDGLALSITAPADTPHCHVPDIPEPRDPWERWVDPRWRVHQQTAIMARTWYGGTAYPAFDSNLGPGSLGLFLGCDGNPAPDTVWYEPCLHDYATHPPLQPDVDGDWWRRHDDMISAGLDASNGTFLIEMPDLIENIDTLAQLRGSEQLLMDLVEQPDDVERRLDEINAAWFAAFERFFFRIQDPWGGNAFCAFKIWGPGRTAKLQCDASCMFSPRDFRRFVQPRLAEQCRWLDYSLYHLDGTTALHQLPCLLEIEQLQAIEWTPQAGLPGGGSPEWYPLYRQIKAGGKRVQAINVRHDEVLPLIDAVGADGLCILASAPSEADGRRVLKDAGWPEEE